MNDRIEIKIDRMSSDLTEHRIDDARMFGEIQTRLDALDRDAAEIKSELRSLPDRIAKARQSAESTEARVEKHRAITTLAKKAATVFAPLVLLIGAATALIKGWL